jgi:hypothetical protein
MGGAGRARAVRDGLLREGCPYEIDPNDSSLDGLVLHIDELSVDASGRAALPSPG